MSGSSTTRKVNDIQIISEIYAQYLKSRFNLENINPFEIESDLEQQFHALWQLCPTPLDIPFPYQLKTLLTWLGIHNSSKSALNQLEKNQRG